MTQEQIRKVYEARPFQPFTLFLADGTRLRVLHNDFMWIPPTATRTVWIADADGTARIVDLLLVAAIELTNGKSARKRRKNGSNGSGEKA